MRRTKTSVVRSSLSLLSFVALAMPLAAQQRQAAPRTPPDPFRFQMLGPAEGGRISAVSGVPGNDRIWYLGAASGGVWRSLDSGATFTPVFDSMDVQSIGALAVAPSKPSIVWAGTGEAWAIRDADLMGDGVYKSLDSGTTWTHMGLPESGRIQRILINPVDPNVVFVCALGRATGPQPERGVFRTKDGGKTWTHVLSVDENTGCSGLTMDPHNPNTLFAGMWQVVMHTWAMFSGGPGSGIYASHDGGATWTHVQDKGLPTSPLGKIDVAIAPTNAKRVYALIQTADQGSVWRSDDGGKTWHAESHERTLIGRAGYYINIKVSSANPDEVLIANSSFWRSTDGGKTFAEMRSWGGDNHDIWIDPKNADHIGLTNDLGARLTTDHGKTFLSVALPVAQAYHVAVDNQIPYWVYTNRQDNGTMRGPSTAPEGATQTRGIASFEARGRRGGPPTDSAAVAARGGRGGRGATAADSTRRVASARGARGGRGARADSTASDSTGGRGGFGGGFGGSSTWDHGLGGCESGFTLPDPTNPDIVWASCYGNEVTRYDHTVDHARSVSPWIHTLDSPPDSLKYRCHWTPPLAIDPFDHNTVYYGCQVVFKTSNEGQSWSVISPDLSTRDPSRIVSSGGIVADNLGQFYGEVVFAIAPSDIQQGLIWAGTNDGQLWYTKDGGGNWTNVSKNMTGLPAWGTIRKIEPSHFDPATAYVAVDFHMMDNRKPYIYKTTDFGQTWTNITGDLPATSPLDYVMAVTENPNRRGMLFAGTGHGFFYSMDDGGHWTQFNDGLPKTEVSWIVVPKLWHDVVVSTYGRGIYILRDIAPLEQPMSLADAPAALYPPHPGYREARSGHADITFALKSATPRPIHVQILDSTGTVIRTLQTATRAGLNRVVWDLHYDDPKRVDLRTVAPDNPFIFDEPRFNHRPTRPVTHWGIQGAENAGPIAVPGHYTVQLAVNGVKLKQPLTILESKEIKTPAADLVASTEAQIRIRNDMDTTVAMINELETMRKAIADDQKANAGKSDVQAALTDIEKKMMNVELQLLSRSDLNSDDKYYVEPFKVYLSLIWLSGEVGNGAGDVAGGSDYAPTDASLAWLGTIEQHLDKAKSDYQTLMEVDVPAFNKLMGGKIATIAETGKRIVP